MRIWLCALLIVVGLGIAGWGIYGAITQQITDVGAMIAPFVYAACALAVLVGLGIAGFGAVMIRPKKPDEKPGETGDGLS